MLNKCENTWIAYWERKERGNEYSSPKTTDRNLTQEAETLTLWP